MFSPQEAKWSYMASQSIRTDVYKVHNIRWHDVLLIPAGIRQSPKAASDAFYPKNILLRQAHKSYCYLLRFIFEGSIHATV